MGTLNRDTIVSILLLLFCGFLIWAGTQIRDPQFGELSPAAWPKAVTYVLTVFCLVYFLQSIRAGADDPAEADPDRQPGLIGWVRYYSNPIACFALYFLFLLTLPYLGTLIGGVLLVFALLSLLGGFTPKQMLIHGVIAAISVGVMWAIFTFGLGVLLPRGELFQSF